MTDLTHEQLCFLCWLKAVGIDERVGVALVSAAFRLGYAQAAVDILPEPAASLIAQQPASIGPGGIEWVLAKVRQILAVPASPDVAEAMRADHA